MKQFTWTFKMDGEETSFTGTYRDFKINIYSMMMDGFEISDIKRSTYEPKTTHKEEEEENKL